MCSRWLDCSSAAWFRPASRLRMAAASGASISTLCNERARTNCSSRSAFIVSSICIRAV